MSAINFHAMEAKGVAWPDVSDKATLCDLAAFIINHFYGTTTKKQLEMFYFRYFCTMQIKKNHVSVRSNQYVL